MKPTATQKGFVLLTSVLILTTLLMLGSYLLASSISESKISVAESVATKNYYLAESGLNEMIWKVQNDPTIKQAFLNGTLSSADDIHRTNVFDDQNASYQVSIKNTVPAEAWIISTSTYAIGGSVSQRVVKSYVSKATGSGAQWDFAIFAGGRGSQQNGNFTFTGSGIVLTANGGRIHANQVLKVQGAEVVMNNGVVSSSNVIDVVAGGKLTLNNSYQSVPTTTVDMLQIDFDSSDPNSWKNRATVTYTPTQFSNLPDNTALNGIIFVTGNANVTGKNMTINGVLVAQGAISINNSDKTFTINSDLAYGGGVLSKNDVNFTTSGGTVLINGIIYAADNLSITSSATNFTINGSMNGFDAKMTASGGSIILNYTPANYVNVIDPVVNPNAPLIQISHWEEQY